MMALATNPPASPFGLLAVYFPPLVPLTFGVVAQQKKKGETDSFGHTKLI